jgi:hypothetical protein
LATCTQSVSVSPSLLSTHIVSEENRQNVFFFFTLDLASLNSSDISQVTYDTRDPLMTDTRSTWAASWPSSDNSIKKLEVNAVFKTLKWWIANPSLCQWNKCWHECFLTM